jgi:hypothetical protein
MPKGMEFTMRRMVCFLFLLSILLGSGRGWAASSPGGGQTESGKNSNTKGIIAAGVVGVAIVGGLLWWRFHQVPEAGNEVSVRKPPGEAPTLVVAKFLEGNSLAEKTHMGEKVRGLVVDALKHSQAYVLRETAPSDAAGDSALVFSGKVTTLVNFSQAEVAVSRKGVPIFSQTITWFEDREFRKQVARLVDQITEKVK